IFLTGFILAGLPRLLAGKNMVSVQSTAWLIRGVIVLFYGFLIFLDGRPAVILILIVYTLFSAARMVGVAVWNPLIKMVTSSENRGMILAQGNIINQTSSVISKLTSFILTSFTFFSGIIGILLLQIFGVFFNTAAALQLKKIPCREKVEYKKGRNIFVILKESFKRKDRRYPLILKWVTVSVIVLNGLTVAFIRIEAGFNSNLVFLYSMVMALSIILSGLFARTFADRMGSRPLLIGMNIFLAVSFIIWILLPVSSSGDLPVYIFFLLGFFTNFFLWSGNVLVSRVLVNSMPESEAFSYNSMTNFVTAFFSLLIGITAGLLIDSGQGSGLILFNSYSYLFSFAMILSLILVFLSFLLVDKGSLSARETAAILFSFEGMKAYMDIGKLNATEDPVKKKTVLLSISRNETTVATEELHSILASPLSSGKGEVLKTLFSNPRSILLPDILKEASDPGSYHQLKAIFALGSYPGTETEQLLLKLLESKDISVLSNTAKSLSRIGHVSSLSKIRQQAQGAKNAWDKINYLIALRNMDKTGMIFLNTFKDANSINSGMFKQTYYSLISDLLDFKPNLADIYTSKNMKSGEGLKNFLDQTRDLDFFYKSHKDLKGWFKKGNWQEIWEFCFKSLSSKNDLSHLSDPVKNLRAAVLAESQNISFDQMEDNAFYYDSALAAVFITYQILNWS
ncbi:MAG: HEAT repeat domain-containing protein, partial [Spirochaetales bacterium]|nr:HEAT repeat domain-containing protein [Spirochaetales bacterium]